MSRKVNSFIEKIKQELSSIYEAQEAEALAFYTLSELTGARRSALLAGMVEIDEKIETQIDEIVNRLLHSEPPQYIFNRAYFYGLTFKVNSNVLIPRPETEELCDLIIKENKHQNNLKILDIGTGSGCIAITLAKELKNNQVFAMDVSQKALQTAQENAELNKAEINFIEANILKHDVPTVDYFDIIVSNPPYVTNAEKKLMHNNVIKFEPHLALFVEDEEPLIFYSAIINFAIQSLRSRGKIYFEINEAFGEETKNLLEKNNFIQVNVFKDLSGKDRIISAVKK